MPNITRTNLIWGLICALVLVVGLIAGRMGLIGQNSNASLSNFRADFPLQQIRGKTFTNEIVQLDGNAFIDCTFDNVRFKFNGQAPFGFTDVHFHNLTKLQVVSDNPVVETTLKLVGALMSLEKGAQNPPNDNK